MVGTIYDTTYNIGNKFMTKWNKLLKRIHNLSNDLRFAELKKILESYGYVIKNPGGGSSHYTFRKNGKPPITIPKHESIKKAYIGLVKKLLRMKKMKSIDYYMNLQYKLEIISDKDEGGYVAKYPDLPGCITVGETIESVAKNAEDTKKVWLKAALDDGIKINEPTDTDDYSGQFKLRIPKNLHRSLSEHSKIEGVSMNQHCIYLLSKNDALEINNFDR